MESKDKEIWEKMSKIIKENISSKSYNAFIKPIKPISFKEDTLKLNIPRNFHFNWLEEHYKTLLTKTIKHIIGENAKILFNRIHQDLVYDDSNILEQKEKIIIATRDLYENLLLDLKKDPEIIHKINSRDFEEIVSKLLSKMGYEVHVTPKVKDGGKDIIAKFRTPTGDNCLCLVECKKYNTERPVGVGWIRSLFGVVQSERANLGMLVTTSRFTKDARNFEKLHKLQISLKDFNDLNQWLLRLK